MKGEKDCHLKTCEKTIPSRKKKKKTEKYIP